jgi:hypothetical protein
MQTEKQPLAIYLITHKEFEHKKIYQKAVYSHFNKDVEHYFDRSINMPVFFADSCNITIEKEHFERIVAVILIDDKMLLERSDEQKQALQDLTDDESIVKISAAYSKNAYKLGNYFHKHNLVRLYSQNDKHNKQFKQDNDQDCCPVDAGKIDYLITEIAHDITKVLMGKDKIQVFISHAKKDGEEAAVEAQCFFNTQSRLAGFFDANYIQNSAQWEDVLKDGVEDSIFLAFYTDQYSTREWCKKEVLFAKKAGIPIVVANLLESRESRSFPYMANVPVITLKEKEKNFKLITKALLLESVRCFYQKEWMKYCINVFKLDALKNYTQLSSLPELLTLSNHSDKNDFVYPDPPVGHEEIQVLQNMKENLSFNTPLTFINATSNLNFPKIAISVSNSPDITSLGLSGIHLQELIVELARYLLASKTQLLYGGDIHYGGEYNFAQVMVDLVQTYNEHYAKEDTEQAVVTNYAAYPQYKSITDAVKSELMGAVDFNIVEIDPEDEKNKNKSFQAYIGYQSLRAMRERMTDDMHIKIAAGGKLTDFSGLYPGILEEVYLALKAENKPVYLIGAFGGCTAKIIQTLKGESPEEFSIEYQQKQSEKFQTLYHYYEKEDQIEEIDYKSKIEFLQNYGIENLDNGLSTDENERLFVSKNIYEIIALILKGIKSKFNQNI